MSIVKVVAWYNNFDNFQWLEISNDSTLVPGWYACMYKKASFKQLLMSQTQTTGWWSQHCKNNKKTRARAPVYLVISAQSIRLETWISSEWIQVHIISRTLYWNWSLPHKSFCWFSFRILNCSFHPKNAQMFQMPFLLFAIPGILPNNETITTYWSAINMLLLFHQWSMQNYLYWNMCFNFIVHNRLTKILCLWVAYATVGARCRLRAREVVTTFLNLFSESKSF